MKKPHFIVVVNFLLFCVVIFLIECDLIDFSTGGGGHHRSLSMTDAGEVWFYRRDVRIYFTSLSFI